MLTLRRFWIVLDQGKLSEYTNWKERLDLHMEPIDLRLASVREARNSERRFCFEVITPSFKRVYQATSEEDMNDWISAVNNALQSAFEARSQPQPFTSAEPSLTRDIGSVLTGKASHSGSISAGVGNAAAAAGVLRRTTVGGRPSIMRTDSNIAGEEPTKLLQEIRERDQGNTWCADCGSTSKVEWVSINLGILLCIDCSGIHRSLGTHISKVRSLTLDTKSFTVDIIEIIMQIGNRLSNQVWEALLDPALKPSSTAGRDERLKFATNKYSERLYVQPITAGQSHYATPDDTLLASIKQNDIQQVLYALANKANPNAKDKSRSTPAVFLALAAAEPATPGGVPAASTTRSGKTNPAFPVAELLLQNGGEMPTQLPAFPLSPAAKQYFEQRSNKPSSDTLTALPSIRGPGAAAAEREREKLQKRNSSGNRYSGRMSGFGPAT
jgi:Arf-GAP with SH3 domain, ANK repeat and PH domain-containing protein